MVDINTTISVIFLNVNGLDIAIKRKNARIEKK